MSVRERVDDAVCLWKNGRKHGALLCLLVAVAATARKRYPEPPKGVKGVDEEAKKKQVEIRANPGEFVKGDRVAFETFILDEMLTLTGGKLMWNVKFWFRGELTAYETILYKFMRNPLVHEADMTGFRFTPTVVVDGKEQYHVEMTNPFGLPEQWVWFLAEAVSKVSENKGLFDDVSNPFAS
jgi:hypothetical protein